MIHPSTCPYPSSKNADSGWVVDRASFGKILLNLDNVTHAQLCFLTGIGKDYRQFSLAISGHLHIYDTKNVVAGIS